MTGICPTGGQANNILRYEDFDTGGMSAKPFESEYDVPDPVLDKKHGVGVQEPPDLEGTIEAIGKYELISCTSFNHRRLLPIAHVNSLIFRPKSNGSIYRILRNHLDTVPSYEKCDI